MFTTSPSKGYTNLVSFTQPNASIHALALSSTGDTLASGGTEGIKLWDLRSHKELACSNPTGSYGAISCAIWIRTKYGFTETLCYGTALGYLVFLRSSPMTEKQYQEVCIQRLGGGFEVTCIANDTAWPELGARIVVGMRDGVIQILLLNASLQLQPVFSGRMNHTIPKSIAFSQRGIVYIFGLYDGNIIKMNASDGAILSEYRLDSVIGCASVYAKKELVVIDNATNGFTLYSLDNAAPIRYYITDPPLVPLPKQVAFGEDSRLIIGGSDNGSIYLFERRTGQLLSKLLHSKDGLVQTIAVRDVGGRCIIASVSPARGRKKALVRVWTCNYAARKAMEEVRTASRWNSLVSRILLLLFATGILALWQTESFGQLVTSVQISQWLCGHRVADHESIIRQATENSINKALAERFKAHNPKTLRAFAAQLADLTTDVHKYEAHKNMVDRGADGSRTSTEGSEFTHSTRGIRSPHAREKADAIIYL